MRAHYNTLDGYGMERFPCGKDSEQPWAAGTCAARVLEATAAHLSSDTLAAAAALLHAAFAFPCSWSDSAIDAALLSHTRGAPTGGRVGLLERAAAGRSSS